MISLKQQPYCLLVHVYSHDGVEERLYECPRAACDFARKQFKREDVYKVKVWAGAPVPNVDEHPYLILHLI